MTEGPSSQPSARANRAARQVLDAAFEVHSALGPGFLESVYRDAMAIELGLRGASYQLESQVDVWYKGKLAGQGRIDLLVDDCLIVELKTVDAISPIHVAQLMSYMKATRLELGLLINFKVDHLRNGIKRVVRTL